MRASPSANSNIGLGATPEGFGQTEAIELGGQLHHLLMLDKVDSKTRQKVANGVRSVAAALQLPPEACNALHTRLAVSTQPHTPGRGAKPLVERKLLPLQSAKEFRSAAYHGLDKEDRRKFGEFAAEVFSAMLVKPTAEPAGDLSSTLAWEGDAFAAFQVDAAHLGVRLSETAHGVDIKFYYYDGNPRVGRGATRRHISLLGA